jgi:hypothetical protein
MVRTAKVQVRPITLLTAAKRSEISEAPVLAGLLTKGGSR